MRRSGAATIVVVVEAAVSAASRRFAGGTPVWLSLRAGSATTATLLTLDYSWRRSVQFKLVAHFLEARGESINLLLLLSDNRFQVLHLMMFF